MLSGNVVNRTELRVKHDIAMFCRRFSHESVRGSIHRVRACGGCACIPLPPFPEFSLVIPGNNRVQAASARPLFGAVQAGKKALRRTLSSGRLRFRGCDVRLCASFSLSLFLGFFLLTLVALRYIFLVAFLCIVLFVLVRDCALVLSVGSVCGILVSLQKVSQ